MSFTDQKPWVVTARDLKLNWGGSPKNFRCGFCGHRFKEGDTARWLYTNDLPGAGGNPLMCVACDTGSNTSTRERWKDKRAEWKKQSDADKNWFFLQESKP